MDIKKRADELARRCQTRNPFEIIQGLNVILLFVPLVNTRAFYQYFQRNNIIYIDENLSRSEQMFECAHEMGHMFLHKDTNTIFIDSRTRFNTSGISVRMAKGVYLRSGTGGSKKYLGMFLNNI